MSQHFGLSSFMHLGVAIVSISPEFKIPKSDFYKKNIKIFTFDGFDF